MKQVILVLFTLFLSGCTFNFWYKDFDTNETKLRAPKLHLLNLGMTKSEVSNVLGEPDQIIGGKQVKGKFIETWEYHRFKAVQGPDELAERYYVEFTESKLSSYGASGDFKQEIHIKK